MSNKQERLGRKIRSDKGRHHRSHKQAMRLEAVRGLVFLETSSEQEKMNAFLAMFHPEISTEERRKIVREVRG